MVYLSGLFVSEYAGWQGAVADPVGMCGKCFSAL